MNTQHDHDPNEVRLTQLLRSVDEPRAEPASERLAQLRERSLQLFAETPPASPGKDAATPSSDTNTSSSPIAPATPAAPLPTRPRMFTFAIRTAAAVAAGI